MKTLLVITHIDFWNLTAGHCARLNSMLSYIQSHVKISVLFVGVLNAGDNDASTCSFPNIDFIFLNTSKRYFTPAEYCERTKYMLIGRCFDFSLITFIEFAFLLPCLPMRTIKLLDTHDLVSEKIKSFESHGVKFKGWELNFQQELVLFGQFDYVLLINKHDYDLVGKYINKSRLLLVPHGVHCVRTILSSEVTSLSFIGSRYHPNVDAMLWFFNEIWPQISSQQQLTINIYGDISNMLDDFENSISDCRIHRKGLIKSISEVYTDSTIVINPVRIGAGLKIKNVEALAHGIPLVTTEHGMKGLAGAKDMGLQGASNANTFAAMIDNLVTNHVEKVRCGNEGFEYAKAHFSCDVAYKELTNLFP